MIALLFVITLLLIFFLIRAVYFLDIYQDELAQSKLLVFYGVWAIILFCLVGAFSVAMCYEIGRWLNG
jgi:hypothetical protein